MVDVQQHGVIVVLQQDFKEQNEGLEQVRREGSAAVNVLNGDVPQTLEGAQHRSEEVESEVRGQDSH